MGIGPWKKKLFIKLQQKANILDTDYYRMKYNTWLVNVNNQSELSLMIDDQWSTASEPLCHL